MRRFVGPRALTLAAALGVALTAAPALAQQVVGDHPIVQGPLVKTPANTGTTTSSVNPGKPGLTDQSTTNPGTVPVANPHRGAANASGVGGVNAPGGPLPSDNTTGAQGPRTQDPPPGPDQHSQDQHSQDQHADVGWDNPQGKNPALTIGGMARASKLLDAGVYAGNGQQLGTLDDILLSRDGHSADAVVDVSGGFLGAGGKLVKLPFSALRVSSDNKDGHKIVLPGATARTLRDMPSFAYDSSDTDNGLKPSLKRSLGSNGHHG